jgi:hypothetical protein
MTLVAGPAASTSDTEVEFQFPLANSNVSGEINLIVEAGANVTGVDFYQRSIGDWTYISAGVLDSPGVYNGTWDTTIVPDGTYDIMANGSLIGGNSTESVLSSVTVDNTIPTVQFITPQTNQRLRGYYQIELQASDDVVSVFLYKDQGSGFVPMGNAEYDDVSDQWIIEWNTTGITEKGDIGIIASGWDRAGNEGRTVVLGLQVDNVPPPAILIRPRDNATLDGYYRLRGNSSDTYAVTARFEWRVGSGAWLKAGDGTWNDSLEEWRFLWNTYEVGEYTDVDVRIAVVDDLGQWGYGAAFNITITDLPPEPTFLSPSEEDHLNGQVILEAISQNDTVSMEFLYDDDGTWMSIGDGTLDPDDVWRISWNTPPLSIHLTTLKALATDGSGGEGEATVTSIEVDNTPPEPNLIHPSEGEYRLFHTFVLTAMSDRDTVTLSFSYKDGDMWIPCGDATYNWNNDRWELEWEITFRIIDSAICATAMDEVGLVGTDYVANIELGLEPGDRKPVFTSGMPETIFFPEDLEYDLNITEYVDDDTTNLLKAYVVGEPISLFRVFGENRTGSLQLTFIPNVNAWGEANVMVYIEDPAGQWARTELGVIIESVPDAPYFTAVPPNLFVHPGIPYEFDYGPYIRDDDDAKENLSIEQPDDIHVSKNLSNPLALIFLYDESELDSHFPVTIRVVDNDGTFTNQSIQVTVTEDFVPEQRKPLPNQEMWEDQSNPAVFNLDDFFYDPDHDTLYFSYGNNFVRVVISNSYPHTVGIFLPGDWSGSDSVTFRAKDPTGALLEDTISIIVHAINDPPMFLDDPPIPRIIVHENVSYDYDLSPYVIDVDGELGDLALVTDDPFATRSNKYVLGLRLAYPFRENAFNIEVTIRDPEGGNVTHIINVLVTDDNYPPYMKQPPSNMAVDEGATIGRIYDVTSAADPDWIPGVEDWKELSYEFICGQATFTVNLATGWVGVWLTDPDWNTYNGTTDSPIMVIFRVKDATGAFTEYTFFLTVRPVNDKPIVGDIPDIVIESGIQNIDLRNYIRDVDTPFASLTYDIQYEDRLTDIVTQANFVGGLLILNYEGSGSRTDDFILWVIDGDHRVNTTFSVEVKGAVPTEEESSLWLVLVVALATGSVAMVASRYVWGRFEPPSVSDVFLVYGDGVIIRHLSKRGSITMDEDLAIAMLTAIQEFVQQSMRSAQLKSMQAGENNILIERDPDRLFYIAVIHTGTVSEELRTAVNSTTRAIREHFSHILERWDGNIAKFDGVERYLQEILVITHAHIPEGVRFEMEGITSIELGKMYLFQGKDVTRTHNIFRGLVEEQDSGLLISRVHPQRLHGSIEEAGADCVWLSKTPTKRGVSPSNTTMILHEITTFVRERERTVVCLDGLEYLLVHNPLDEVMAFVNELSDMVQLEDFIMMVHVDPDALDEATLAKLSRDMVPVVDQR